MMLVTLEQANDHLRRDSDEDDNDLILKIEAASEAIVEYLKGYSLSFIDANGAPVIGPDTLPVPAPRLVQSATLIMVGYLYREREGSNEFSVPSTYGYGFLPVGVTSLLYPLRKPTLS